MRTYNYDILKEIKARWSPRAFSSESVSKEDLEGILEAARYAPSCYNEQPWRYVIGMGDSLATMQSLLLPGNMKWAKDAPVLILLVGKKIFTHNDKYNSYTAFDSGTSWGYLALEATRRGYFTHGMAGFDKALASEKLGLSEAFEPLIMIALGKPGSEEALNDQTPNERKNLNEIMFRVGDDIR